MRVTSHQEAEAELIAAVTYYETCCHGLGRDFLDEFEAGIEQICHYPNA